MQQAEARKCACIMHHRARRPDRYGVRVTVKQVDCVTCHAVYAAAAKLVPCGVVLAPLAEVMLSNRQQLRVIERSAPVPAGGLVPSPLSADTRCLLAELLFWANSLTCAASSRQDPAINRWLAGMTLSRGAESAHRHAGTCNRLRDLLQALLEALLVLWPKHMPGNKSKTAANVSLA